MSSSIDIKIHDGKLYTDFHLVCNNGMSFPCHKAFLAANSSVLKKMLDCNMKEVENDEMVLKDYEETVVESFVRFLYTEEVDYKVLKEHAASFLELGETYKMQGLKSMSSFNSVKRIDFTVNNFMDAIEKEYDALDQSPQFSYNGTLWHIEVNFHYPYPRMEGETTVSVCLCNDNYEDFSIDAKIIVGDLERKFENQNIEAYSQKPHDPTDEVFDLTQEECISSLVEGKLEIQMHLKLHDCYKPKNERIVVTDKGFNSDLNVKRIDFTVNNFMDSFDNKYLIESPQFRYNDTLWHIEVEFPYLGRGGVENPVNVLLSNDKYEDVSIDAKLIVGDFVEKFENQDNEAYSRTDVVFHLTNEECISSLVEGKLEIQLHLKVHDCYKPKPNEDGIIMTMTDKGIVPVKESRSIDIKIHEEKLNTDFRLVCSNGKSFPCHKAFLAANSSVFERMIESNMEEVKNREMVLKNYEETVVENCVKFLYTGKVDCKVLKEHAVSFLELGEMYNMQGLKDHSEQFMIASLSVENVLSFLCAGVMFRGEEIKNVAKVFFKANRNSLDSKEVLEAIKGNEDLMRELLF